MESPMLSETLGVDLASQPKKTGLCRLRWRADRAQVLELDLGVDDDAILTAAADGAPVGIDAPFGWPEAFVQLVGSYADPDPATIDWSDEETRRALRMRRTDIHVWKEHLGRPPLSVSADAIAMPAMRCVGLLSRLGVGSRADDRRVFEVYPALALHRWVGISKGYKGPEGRPQRASIVAGFRARAPWLEVPNECIESDDMLDALVAAVVTRAAAIGKVEPIPAQHLDAAATEGWIVVPTASLDDLAP